MADILSTYTREQLKTLTIDYILAQGTALTDFNEGSVNDLFIEAVCNIESVTGFDYIQALRKAIPVALYDGFNFTKLPDTAATGFLRFFRIPSFTLNYTGTGTSALLNITNTTLTTTVTGGGGGEDLNINFATFDELKEVVDEINAHASGSWVAVQVGLDTDTATDFYDYVNKEIVSSTNYLNNAGVDIMSGTAAVVPIAAGVQAQTDDSIVFQTTVASQIDAGEATSPAIAAEAVEDGEAGNIVVKAIDTLNGKGATDLPEYAVNDSAFVNGADEETDTERADRFQDFVKGLASSTPAGMRAAVRGIEGIKSATILPNNPAPGFNTVVADDGTGNLSASLQAEILKVLNGDLTDLVNYPGTAAEGIQQVVTGPTVQAVVIDITAQRIGELADETEIENSVQTAVEQYVNTRRLGDDVIVSEIVRVAKSSHPGIHDLIVNTPLANIPIADDVVARVGAGVPGSSLTITVVTLPSPP